jgi:hypothetical protein
MRYLSIPFFRAFYFPRGVEPPPPPSLDDPEKSSGQYGSVTVACTYIVKPQLKQLPKNCYINNLTTVDQELNKDQFYIIQE